MDSKICVMTLNISKKYLENFMHISIKEYEIFLIVLASTMNLCIASMHDNIIF